MAKIQSLRSQKKEMTEVARGVRKASADAGEASYEVTVKINVFEPNDIVAFA